MKQRLLAILEARVSVPTWILLFISVGIAGALCIYLYTAPEDVQPFAMALPFFNATIWGLMLVTAGFITGVCIAANRMQAVAWSSFVSFVLWVFGALSFWATGGQLTVVLIVIPLLVFHAYLFLGPLLRDRDGL